MVDTEQRPDEGRGFLGRLLHRLSASPEELDAEELQSEVGKVGARACSQVSRGQAVRVTGRLRSVVYTPRETTPTLEAELFDGSGTVLLVWLGRRRIPGIEPGRALVASGRIAERDGACVLYNPEYDLLPSAV